MVKVVAMEEQHIDQVYAIELDSFSIPWSRKDIEDEIRINKLALYFVAVDGDEVLGYGGMWHVVNEGHITNIAVNPAQRRNGVGSLLLEEMIRIAVEKEMIGLTLEVRVGNEAAQKLYSKYGFKPEGFRKNYYSDTKEDAVVMWKHLEAGMSAD